MDYKDYTVADFMRDPLFRLWVFHPDKETDDFWAKWLNKNTRYSYTLYLARYLLLLKEQGTATPTARDKADVKNSICNAIGKRKE